MKKCLLSFLKIRKKTENRFKAVSDLQNNQEGVSVQSGNIFRYLRIINFLWSLSTESPIPRLH